MSNIAHVCFDKDGTLIDVHASWVPITVRRAKVIAHAYGLNQDFESSLVRLMGVDLASRKIIYPGPVGYQPRPVIVSTVCQWLISQSIPTCDDDLNSLFRNVDSEIQKAGEFNAVALPGVVDGIQKIKEAGFKISIYTSDRHENARRVMELLGIRQWIDAIVGGDDVQSPKPHPEGFLKACAKINVDPRQSIYVGDTFDDMRMAHACACAGGFAIAQGLTSLSELKELSQKSFATFQDFVEFIIPTRVL